MNVGHNGKRTGIVAANRGLHYSFHPLTDYDLLFGAEEVRLLRVMNDLEAVTTWIDVLVGNHLVPLDVDISLNFRFLFEMFRKLEVRRER